MTKLKTSIFSRTLSVAKMGLNAGAKYALHKATAKATGQHLDHYITDQAAYLTGELGQLKGSLMKAGQMLSMYGEYFFPPQANEYLKKLQSDSPTMEWAVLKNYLNDYLPADIIDELQIEPVPIGSASMGQVHKAIIKSTGEKIALKIQYPNLELAIDSDVKALKTLLSFSKILPQEMNLDSIFEEIKLMLRQELDYKMEAQRTEKYGELLKNDSRYKVPKVFYRYSSDRVLATEYLEGFKADHALVQALSQKRRDRLSENFIELYFREIFAWNFVQTDPHLGNYKIHIDSHGHDQLVLLDFGASKEFDSPFIENYRRLVKGSILKDELLFITAAQDLGFIIPKDTDEYIQAFKSFCYETVEPFALEHETYNWKDTDLPSRVVKKAIQFKNFDLRTPPKDILFLDRKTGGVFIFLSVLKANINARKLVDPFLNSV